MLHYSSGLCLVINIQNQSTLPYSSISQYINMFCYKTTVEIAMIEFYDKFIQHLINYDTDITVASLLTFPVNHFVLS